MCEPAAIFSPLISSFSCTPWDCAVLSHSIGDAEAAGGERKWHNQCRQKNTVTITIGKKQISQPGRDLSDSVTFHCCPHLFFTLHSVNFWAILTVAYKMRFVLNYLPNSLRRRGQIINGPAMFKETWMWLNTDDHLHSSTARMMLCSQQKAAHWKCVETRLTWMRSYSSDMRANKNVSVLSRSNLSNYV